MSNEHISVKEARINQKVFKQDYVLKIIYIGKLNTVQVEGHNKNVQDLVVTDGTDAILFTVWSAPDNPIYKLNGGMEVTGAYITPDKNGKIKLRVAGSAKGGSVRYTDTSNVQLQFDFEAWKESEGWNKKKETIENQMDEILGFSSSPVGISQNIKDAAKKVFNWMYEHLDNITAAELFALYKPEIDLLNKELEL